MRRWWKKPVNKACWPFRFPEEYGGLGKDFVTSTIVNEYLVQAILFPWLFPHIPALVHFLFYTLVQKNKKQKYIPKLISGEWKVLMD